jgi:hypothetical protein
MNKRPFGITLLAIFALLAALAAAWHTLQMLHIIPVSFGEMRFFTFDLLGAILWGIMFLVYLWVFRMLWNLDPQGWLFVVVLAVINLILALLSVLGASSFTSVLPSVLFNALVLIYANMPGVKSAFGLPAAR